jgi:hypothetical protein
MTCLCPLMLGARVSICVASSSPDTDCPRICPRVCKLFKLPAFKQNGNRSILEGTHIDSNYGPRPGPANTVWQHQEFKEFPRLLSPVVRKRDQHTLARVLASVAPGPNGNRLLKLRSAAAT